MKCQPLNSGNIIARTNSLVILVSERAILTLMALLVFSSLFEQARGMLILNKAFETYERMCGVEKKRSSSHECVHIPLLWSIKRRVLLCSVIDLAGTLFRCLVEDWFLGGERGSTHIRKSRLCFLFSRRSHRPYQAVFACFKSKPSMCSEESRIKLVRKVFIPKRRARKGHEVGLDVFGISSLCLAFLHHDRVSS
jgi:hypothetical protein